jgi:hypothetical protein
MFHPTETSIQLIVGMTRASSNAWRLQVNSSGVQFVCARYQQTIRGPVPSSKDTVVKGGKGFLRVDGKDGGGWEKRKAQRR